MDDQDRRRKRGLIAFQLFIYGLLIAMFAIQLQMYLTRHLGGPLQGFGSTRCLRVNGGASS